MKGLFTWIPQFFLFSENKTNFRTEILAGVTTFLTMAYILADFSRGISDQICFKGTELNQLKTRLI